MDTVLFERILGLIKQSRYNVVYTDRYYLVDKALKVGNIRFKSGDLFAVADIVASDMDAFDTIPVWTELYGCRATGKPELLRLIKSASRVGRGCTHPQNDGMDQLLR